jgi:spermidine synthase
VDGGGGRTMTDTTDAIYEVSESDARTIYPVARRLWSGRTEVQAVEIADSPTYGRLLFLDGELQSASADEAVYHEALVHPAMTAASARVGSVSGGAGASRGLRVLVVGGGEGATVREVLRWSCVERVDWVDIDGELVALCEEHLGWAPGVRGDPRVHFYAEDVMVAVPRLGETYDVVILDLPDPDGETGALYSAEFWAMIREHLRSDGGRLVTHCGPVRPFGNVGEGFQRVWASAQAGDIEAAVGGFYHIGIPSFQGEWGFWMMVTGAERDRPFEFVRSGTSLSVLRAIAPVEAVASWFDFTWLTRCAAPDRLWSQAVTAAVGRATST